MRENRWFCRSSSTGGPSPRSRVCRPRDVEVRHSFQTNATLLNDRWCEFFAEHDVKVGVSIDGPQRFHDRNRLTRSGRGTFDRTIAGVRLLRKHGLPFHVISVLTAESLAAPQEMFDFYVAEGIDQVCFNVEETEGDHQSQSFAHAGIENAYYRFLAEFWRLAAASPAKLSFIREIEDATHRVLRPKEAIVANQLTTPFAMLNVDWTGNIATFSPELLGLKNAEYGDFILGNVNRDRLTELSQRPTFLKIQADIDAGVALCRETCEYFSRLRRRRADQQAVRKRQLRQHRDNLLPNDKNADDGSRARFA